jgi:hypothetical protein
MTLELHYGESAQDGRSQPGPAFGRPDDELRSNDQFQCAKLMGLAKGSAHLARYHRNS